jgi:ABC-type multidrug transport system ATPase subunit
LIRSFIREFEVDSGLISVFGSNIVDDYNSLYQNVSIVFQENVSIPTITTYEFLEFFAKANDIHSKQEDIQKFVSLLDLNDINHNYINQLSG